MPSYYYADCKKRNIAFCVDCASPIPLTIAMRAPGSSYLLRASWSAHPAARSARPNVGSIDPGLIQSTYRIKEMTLHVEHIPLQSCIIMERQEPFMQGAPWSMMGRCIELAHASRLQNVFRTFDSWRDECSSPLASNNMPSVSLLLEPGIMVIWCMYVLISH